MQLTFSATPDAHVRASQLQTATPSAQRPKLSMVWHQEFNGKHVRMVARWVVA